MVKRSKERYTVYFNKIHVEKIKVIECSCFNFFFQFRTRSKHILCLGLNENLSACAGPEDQVVESYPQEPW